MNTLEVLIEKFKEKGEKTNWSYVFIPAEFANTLKPDNKKSFRIKGSIDNVAIKGIALLPYGNGDFIIPINQKLRKDLGKADGDKVLLMLEEDREFKMTIPADLMDCLQDEEHLLQNFYAMAKSHQNYFIKWIQEAKTMDTRVKRISQTVTAMDNKWSYSEMTRFFKK
ncbi:Domain of unknown function DUF1905 [Pseudopedobacter saltans DSM 12145]|uniref:DUF1905 domain-containing protein n=1 Tax=Pseudopedobacter saltans (strain ATCC 51119 / DSM 12145 / JCM 21818 / CCUG 39354 / LMG 10337 / NBRC 100064 / NCIMB 13643) TaxID=762903 RepID=F0S4I1_PSESL|nr:YdeI/OmpD-associated family protein [Pseudopedobacter saltans]ADY51972.1 Domain of unknown function DUF1905 [Pseudopedobacter saltans DSM 12145]